MTPVLLAAVAACSSDRSVGKGSRGEAERKQVVAARSAVTNDNAGSDVVQHHNHANRDGVFTQPALTRTAAAGMSLDATFTSTFTGNVYAQPLYVGNGVGGKGTFYVVTESNSVYAIDEKTGATLWSKSFGDPAISTGAGCGNISPLGITGTPYIDVTGRTMYFSAAVGTDDGTAIDSHQIHAISLDDGAERVGWPVDTSTLTSTAGVFQTTAQNQRGALIVVGDTLYVPYGGHYGDCGDYRGAVVGVPLSDPSLAKIWVTGSTLAGIWAPSGLASDGTSIFTTTGNGTDFSAPWNGSEAVIRLGAGPTFSKATTDYFAPTDWATLDARDADLGGSGPLLLDVAGATPSKLVAAFGKDGKTYLMDRTDLGGVGGQLAVKQVSTRVVINASASVTTSTGTYVVLRGGCTGTGSPGGLIGLKIGAASPPTISNTWCTPSAGRGSPAITTTDGSANSIVWVVSAESTSQKLFGYNAETGDVVFDGGTDVMTGVRRFTSVIAVNGRIIVAADGALYAFKP